MLANSRKKYLPWITLLFTFFVIIPFSSIGAREEVQGVSDNTPEFSDGSESSKEEESTILVEEEVKGEEGRVGGESVQGISVYKKSEEPVGIGETDPDVVGNEVEDIQDQVFEDAAFVQTSLKKIPVGSVRSLSIDLANDGNVRLLDLSKYEDGYLVFKWKAESFEYGLANEKVIPNLLEVEVSDEVSEYSDTKASELIDFRSKKFLFLRPLGDIGNLTFDIISPSEGMGGGFFAQVNHDSGAKYSSLNIIPREVWSGDPDINSPDRLVWDPVYYKVNKFVVHHTVTPNDRDPIEDIRAIYLYHRYSIPWYGGYGFGDIGYNYLIDRNGNIYEGKLGGEEAKGYHAGDANPSSIGVAVMGTYTSVAPSQAAQNALVRLMAEKGAFYNFDPDWHVTVFGHRDYMATACPGNAFYPLLPGLSGAARSYKYSYFGFISSAEQQVRSDISNSDYRPGKLALVWYSSADIAIPAWSGIDSYVNYNNTTTLTVTDTSTPYESVSDRMRTLYLIYALNGKVKDVGLIHRGQIPEVQ